MTFVFFQLTSYEAYVEFLEKLDLNFLGLSFDDARIIQGMLDILELLAERSTTASGPKSLPILDQLQACSTLVDEYKKNLIPKIWNYDPVMKSSMKRNESSTLLRRDFKQCPEISIA